MGAAVGEESVQGWVSVMPTGSNYVRTLSLREALNLEAIVAYKLRSTGAKMLINPNAE